MWLQLKEHLGLATVFIPKHLNTVLDYGGTYRARARSPSHITHNKLRSNLLAFLKERRMSFIFGFARKFYSLFWSVDNTCIGWLLSGVHTEKFSCASLIFYSSFFRSSSETIINKKAQLTQGLRATAPSVQDGGCSKMDVTRHLGYYRTENSAIQSAEPENPCLEPIFYRATLCVARSLWS